MNERMGEEMNKCSLITFLAGTHSIQLQGPPSPQDPADVPTCSHPPALTHLPGKVDTSWPGLAWGGFVSLKIQVFLRGRDSAGLKFTGQLHQLHLHSPSLGPQAGEGHFGIPVGGHGARGTRFTSCLTTSQWDLGQSPSLSQPLFPLLQNGGEAAPLQLRGASSPLSQPLAHGRRPGLRQKIKAAKVYRGCPRGSHGLSCLFLTTTTWEGGPFIIPTLQMGSKAQWS